MVTFDADTVKASKGPIALSVTELRISTPYLFVSYPGLYLKN